MFVWLSKLFRRSKPLPDSHAVLDEAIAWLQEGRSVDAVTKMKHCVDAIRSATGDKSLPYAASLFHYGTFLCAMGNMNEAVALCRRAADACPSDHEGRKNRLTYLMNVGQLLSRDGKANEAIPVLQASLQERTAFYGDKHSGVAYGQQVLAEAYLATGDYASGLKHARDAVKTFQAERHAEFPGTFGLQAALASASGAPTEEVWRGLADYPESVVVTALEQAFHLAPLMAGVLGTRFLRQAADWCDHYMAEATQVRINTLIAWSNLATEKEDLPSLEAATERLMDSVGRLETARDRIQLLQGCALSFTRCGRNADDVRAVYDQAFTEAETHHLTLPAAIVCRHWAIFEAEEKNESLASDLYDQAVELARHSGDGAKEHLGRALIAKGIYRQHRGQAEEAKRLLVEGLNLLPATHQDAACGMLHQVALDAELDCPCIGGDTLNRSGLAQLARKFFEQSGMADLLESVDFDEKGLSVQLKRKPLPAELERLQIAHSVFLNQLKNPSE